MCLPCSSHLRTLIRREVKDIHGLCATRNGAHIQRPEPLAGRRARRYRNVLAKLIAQLDIRREEPVRVRVDHGDGDGTNAAGDLTVTQVHGTGLGDVWLGADDFPL